MLLKFFSFYGSSHPKKGCSEKSEKILKKTSVGLYNFLILPNKNTQRMVFGKFVKYFKTAILKNNFELLLLRFSVKASHPFLNKNAGCSSNPIH